MIEPKPGVSSVPVYGAAFPEDSAYPKDVTPRANPALAYTILPGQAYVTTGLVPDDNYYAPTVNFSMPHDHTVIAGKTAYYQIILNHRLFIVKADDVTETGLP